MGSAIRILPIVILCLAVMFGVRAIELWTGFSAIGEAHAVDANAKSHAPAHGEGTTGAAPAAAPTEHVEAGAHLPAPAADAGHAPAPTMTLPASAEPKDPNVPDLGHAETPPPAPHAAEVAPPPYATSAARPKIPGEQDFMSASEIEVLSSLTKRREELDKRSAELDMREKLLIATEQRLQEKLAEIKTLEAQIQGVVRTLDENQAKQIASLVKVYETMKPQQAASIMQGLEKDILLEVAARMKEAKMAPILAAMDPSKARELTMMLAKRNEIPGRAG